MKKLLLDAYAALLNLAKALGKPSVLETEVKKAKLEVEQAKKRLSDTLQRTELAEKKKHYSSLVTLQDYGYSRFMVYCQGAVLSAHVTFEFAMISFQELLTLDKPCKVLFEDENGRVEDFTEYFILWSTSRSLSKSKT